MRLYGSERDTPLTEEQMATYKEILTTGHGGQVWPVGMSHGGRQLIHADVDPNVAQRIMDYLTSLGKEPRIVEYDSDEYWSFFPPGTPEHRFAGE